jgi:low temperature requirement protein LtrA
MGVATETGAEDSAERHVEPEQRVTPLELFFDLVFVFAITQVTSLMSESPTWEGMAEGLLVLAAIWWAWAAYSWLTNTIDPEEDLARLSMFAAMAAMLVVALATPKAFGDDGVLFGCAYLAVRVLHVVVYAYASRDVNIRGAVYRFAPTAITAPALLIIAGTLDGLPQAALWAGALALDYAGPAIAGMEGWQVFPAHFAERHGLIVIIALGESLVALGVGASETIELNSGEIAAAGFGLVIVAALWWAYFDVVALVAERKLREAQGVARNALARDSYSYLHLPMIAGIVLLALGVKKALGDPGEPLDTVPAVALCGGVALYLLAHIAFRLRNLSTLNRQRLVTAVVCAALIPVATAFAAVVAVGIVAGLCTSLIAYEAIRFREARARVRAAH